MYGKGGISDNGERNEAGACSSRWDEKGGVGDIRGTEMEGPESEKLRGRGTGIVPGGGCC